MVPSTFPRSFVPTEFDPSDWSAAEPLYRELLAREIASPRELEAWLRDFSELDSVMDEYESRRYIDKSCHTDDAEIERRYMQFVEEIEPRVKPLYFEIQRKFLASPFLAELTDKKYVMLAKNWRADVEIFREENVPLETEVTRLVTEYDTIAGAMMVNFRGQELTLQQAAKYLEEPDRAAREESWRLTAERRYADHERVEAIFDELLALRERIARNAGFADFRAYSWREHKRFDYSPAQCLAFADAIARTCVPLVDELDRRRATELKLDALRPWDLAVDPKNRPALRPFGQDETPLLVEKTKAMFARMSPALAEEFDTLRAAGNLDLESRKGKQPGGYQASLHEARQPFIFMNAAGVQHDVETLLHEGGHAFHMLATRDEELVFVRGAPMEFCEVASMSMELLGAEHFDVFYANAADAARARRTLLEGIIQFLPWMATIDSFQHWLYTNPGHSRAARTAEWLRLTERFGHKLNWGGLEGFRDTAWQRQLHLFHAPFYYIEYGIAQLGALQLWVRSREDVHGAIANYRAALRLGGTRSLPELFSAAGIVFDFSERTLGPLMEAIGEELRGMAG
jgi:oligoendopeptidase F